MGLIRWLKRKLDDGGHFHIGNRITVYWGNNAMHWAVNIYTKKYGYICAHPRTKAKPAYFYLSPNGTPWASTFYIGSDKEEYVRSRIRKTCFGHNFGVHDYDSEYGMENYEILRGINRSVSYSKWQYANYQKERTPNRTETREFKQEFLRMASYIDCLLECSDTQKETLINFIARLSEYMPWYEDDDFEVEKHTPERTETHVYDYGREETHGDTISRRAAIDALWKALYEYEDKTEKQFIDSEELDVADWIQHRIFVQNMSDIDRQTILDLPSAEPESEQHSSTEKDYAYCSDCDNEEPCRWCIRCMRVHRQVISEPERKTGHYYCENCWSCNGGKNEEADIS